MKNPTTKLSRRYHFITGLPRSGSTLLSGILLQNPRFQAGMSSPVLPLCYSLLSKVSAGSEFASLVGQDKRRALVRGVFDAYYGDVEREAVFDTNRQWSSHMPLLHDLFEAPKVIACVRNVAWVMDSFERLYHADPYEKTLLFPHGARNVYGRMEALAKHDGTVGGPWSSLREAFYGPHGASLLLVDYELLTRAPAKVMELVYDFLGEPHFSHDFEQVEYDAAEFDAHLGAPGLHRVKARVEFKPRPTILPPDLFDRYNQMTFWNEKAGSRANVIAAQPAKQGDPA